MRKYQNILAISNAIAGPLLCCVTGNKETVEVTRVLLKCRMTLADDCNLLKIGAKRLIAARRLPAGGWR